MCAIYNNNSAGNESFFWQGPKPSVIITDIALIKEVTAKHNVFSKPKTPNPLTSLFAPGVATLEKEKWAKHRKIINPAFHIDKLKVFYTYIIVFVTYKST